MNTNNTPIVAPATGLKAFNQFITNEATSQYLSKVLAEKKGSFVNNLVALVANNKMLQECKPETVMFAAIKATSLNLPLEPSLGRAWVIPYRDNKAGETLAQFQIGARGLAELAIRTNLYERIYVTEIYEGEYGGVVRRTGEIIINDDVDTTDKEVVGYYGYFRLKNGYESELYWSRAKMQKHAERFSKSVKYGPWATDFDAMSKKTLLKALFKDGYAPMSIEMQWAYDADQAVLTQQGANYVDNATRDAVAQEIEAEANQGEEIGFDEPAQEPAASAQEPVADAMPDVFK